MSLAYIRDCYRVPARLGAVVRVEAIDRLAIVTGCNGDYVQVRVEATDMTMFVHPDDLDWSSK